MRDSWLWALTGPVVFMAAGLVAELAAKRRGKALTSAWTIAGLGGLALYQYGVFLDSRWLAVGGVALILSASIVTLAAGGTRWQRSS